MEQPVTGIYTAETRRNQKTSTFASTELTEGAEKNKVTGPKLEHRMRHGWINPSFAAAATISAAGGADAVPPYTPFSTKTEKAILRPAPPYGAKPMNHA